jgi:DNA-3-methyladenine glycosylase I
MDDGIILGDDSIARCLWAGRGGSALADYHDTTWGTSTYDERSIFEALTLGVFEAGLSWQIVFGRREAFRRAFHGFDVAAVAAMPLREVDNLVGDPRIIRNRKKIEATISNANAMKSASPSLIDLARTYAEKPKRAPRYADIPTSTPRAESLAKTLKSQGYRFVGPTSVYAFMQNVGIVNDHVRGCFRAA